MSYVEFDAFKQTPQYRKALCDALAITARKGGNPIPGVVDSEMNRAFQALNKISPALATGIAYTGSVGNKMYNYFLSDAGQNALRIAEQAATGALDGLTLGGDRRNQRRHKRSRVWYRSMGNRPRKSLGCHEKRIYSGKR